MQFCSFVVGNERRTILPGRIIGEVVERLDVASMIDLVMLNGEADAVDSYDIGEVLLQPPITRPSKIIAVGLNFQKHIEEIGMEKPDEPLLFSKPSSAIVGPGQDIVLPDAIGQIDYEGEVALIIGRDARSVEDGESHIFGYTCLNDVTARDIQKHDKDWTRAKGFDTFAPMGPTISTIRPDWIRTELNGSEVQRSSTDDMIFGCAELVEKISAVMTLYPGDVISTGTPFGVGPLSPSDIVAVEADGIGRLENKVVRKRKTGDLYLERSEGTGRGLQ